MTQTEYSHDFAPAKEAFERLARRLDELWNKQKLTKSEDREIQLILNNALVISELVEGKQPEEFREDRPQVA